MTIPRRAFIALGATAPFAFARTSSDERRQQLRLLVKGRIQRDSSRRIPQFGGQSLRAEAGLDTA